MRWVCSASSFSSWRRLGPAVLFCSTTAASVGRQGEGVSPAEGNASGRNTAMLEHPVT